MSKSKKEQTIIKLADTADSLGVTASALVDRAFAKSKWAMLALKKAKIKPSMVDDDIAGLADQHNRSEVKKIIDRYKKKDDEPVFVDEEPEPKKKEVPKKEERKTNGKDPLGTKLGTDASKINLSILKLGTPTVDEVAADTKLSRTRVRSHFKHLARKKVAVFFEDDESIKLKKRPTTTPKKSQKSRP